MDDVAAFVQRNLAGEPPDPSDELLEVPREPGKSTKSIDSLMWTILVIGEISENFGVFRIFVSYL